jgi:hypothetical protein
MTNQKTANLCADLLTTRVVSRYARERGMAPTKALRHFISTKTYDLLTDPQSHLYEESAEYVMFLLEAEERGDWDRWLKI